MSALTVDQAARLARKAFDGVLDLVAMPYFDTHVAEVHRRVIAAGGGDDEQVAALLAHAPDRPDWTGMTQQRLRAEGTSDGALRIIELLAPDDDPDRRLARIRDDPAARIVLLADIASDTDPVRLARPAPDERRALLARHLHALEVLGEDTRALQALLDATPDAESDQDRRARLDRVLDDRMAARLAEVTGQGSSPGRTTDEDLFMTSEEFRARLARHAVDRTEP